MSKETLFGICNWLIACVVLAICFLVFRDLTSTPVQTKYPLKSPARNVKPVAPPPAAASPIEKAIVPSSTSLPQPFQPAKPPVIAGKKNVK